MVNNNYYYDQQLLLRYYSKLNRSTTQPWSPIKKITSWSPWLPTIPKVVILTPQVRPKVRRCSLNLVVVRCLFSLFSMRFSSCWYCFACFAPRSIVTCISGFWDAGLVVWEVVTKPCLWDVVSLISFSPANSAFLLKLLAIQEDVKPRVWVFSVVFILYSIFCIKVVGLESRVNDFVRQVPSRPLQTTSLALRFLRCFLFNQI